MPPPIVSSVALLLAVMVTSTDVNAGDASMSVGVAPRAEPFVSLAALRWPQVGDVDAFASDDEASPMDAPAAALGEFREGTRILNFYGSAIFGDSGKGEMYLAHAGVGYYIEDYASLNLDFFGGYVRSGIDDDGAVGGLDLVYRKHFERSADDARTLFFEAGAGLQQASTNFAGRRHFNFRLSVGFGATFRLGDRSRLLLGTKYIHISDAGIKGGGGGFDGPMLYAGLTLPF